LEAIQSKRSGDAEEMEFIHAYYLRMAKKEQLLPVIDTPIFWPSRKPFVVPDGPGQMFAALRAVSHDRKAVDLQLSSKFAHWLLYILGGEEKVLRISEVKSATQDSVVFSVTDSPDIIVIYERHCSGTITGMVRDLLFSEIAAKAGFEPRYYGCRRRRRFNG